MPRRRAAAPAIELDDEGDDSMVGSAKVVVQLKPHPVMPHLAKEYFVLKQRANETLECPVCLEKIDCKHCISLWTCGHSFHASCTEACTTTRCPLCNL
jgi:hypothetical protein